MRDEVASQGWTRLDDIGDDELLALLKSIGSPGPAVELVPKEKRAANPASLSGTHGLERFPPHTDGASLLVPPRYVALWSPEGSAIGTLIADGRQEPLQDDVFRTSWTVAGTGRSRGFFAVPRRAVAGVVQWRLNLDCMTPSGAEARQRAAGILAGLEQRVIDWAPRSAVILDNRRVLHSRPAVPAEARRRRLVRVQVFV